MFVFLGFLVAFAFVAYSVWDVERKREKLVDLVKRLEPMAKGDGRTELRHIRRLCRSGFFARNLTNRLNDQLEEIERANGVSEDGESRPLLPSSNKRIAALERRVHRLEELRGAGT